MTWLPADGDAHDVIGINNGTLTSGASFGAGLVGQAFGFDNTTSSVLLSQSAQSSPPLPNVSAVGGMTFELWIKVASFVSGGITDGNGSYFIDRLVSARVGAENPVFSLKAVSGQFGMQIRYDDLTGLGGPIGGAIVVGQWTHIAMVREYGVAFHLYVDGALAASSPDNGRVLHLETTKLGHHFESVLLGFGGSIDEFGIYSRALSQAEIQGIVAAGSSGKCTCALTAITTQPASAAKSVGDAATFSVTATGNALSYQWKKNGVDIPGATTASYSIASVGPTDVGDYTVTVSSCGSVTSIAATLSVTSSSQTITFAALPDHTYGDAPFALNATASSGLTVSFAATGTCSLAASTLTLDAAGSCTVTASQAGDASYSAAPNVQHTFAITPAGQTIIFAGIGDRFSTDPPFLVSATGGLSGNPVTFSSVGSCSVIGNSVTINTVGDCTITALQAGNANYDAAPNVSQTFAVVNAEQTITFTALPPRTYGDVAFALTATASSGLAVSFLVTGNCSLTAITVTITGAGNCSVTASQPGDASYNAAPNVQHSFPIARANQVIVLAAISDHTLGDPPFVVSATGGASGLPVLFSSTGNCSVSNNSVSINSIGGCAVTASQSGDANYNAASTSQSFNVFYRWTGFLQPIDNLPTLNSVNAGRAVPVKFSLNGNRGLAILAAGYPKSVAISCSSSAPIDDVEQTVIAGSSSLSYDLTSDQYVYVWKTDKVWANQCRLFTIRFVDGTEQKAQFKLK